VKPARVDAGFLFDVREERDHVVLRRLLDLVDARDIERNVLRANRGRGAARNQLGLLHCVARSELDFEPGAKAALGGP